MLVGGDRVLSRRLALRLLGSGVSIALLTACNIQTPPTAPTVASAPTTPQGAAQPQSQPQRGGTLRAGLIGDVGAINPHAIGPQPLQTIFAIWDRLLAYDNDGKPQPMLAESWEFSSDQTQLKFNLRHGVQYHTGRELTSDDVKWNLLESATQPSTPRSSTSRACGSPTSTPRTNTRWC